MSFLFWMLDSCWCFAQETQSGQHPWSLSCFCSNYTSLLSVSSYFVPGLGPGGWACWQNLLMENMVQMAKQLFNSAGPLHVGHLHCQKHRGILFLRLKNSHSEWLSECQFCRFWVKVCVKTSQWFSRWHLDSLPEGHLNISLFLSWVLTYFSMTLN